MSTIVEYQAVLPVSRDNQLYQPGELIPLDIRDAEELVKVGAIKLPANDSTALAGAAGTDAQTSANVVLVADGADAELASLRAQLEAALADKSAVLVELQAAQQSLATAQSSLTATVAVETDLKAANAALQTQLADVQQQLDAANATIASTAASADASTSTDTKSTKAA